jgi:hypothetical protein
MLKKGIATVTPSLGFVFPISLVRLVGPDLFSPTLLDEP